MGSQNSVSNLATGIVKCYEHKTQSSKNGKQDEATQELKKANNAADP